MGRHGYHMSPNTVNTKSDVFVMFMSLPVTMTGTSWKSSK